MGLTVNFEFDLYPVKEVFGGFVVYPLAHGKQALSAYSEWTRAVPDTLTSAVRLVHYPPAPVIPEPLRGASAIVLMACFTGSTTDGEALLEPLRSIGTPLLDTFKPMPYAQIAAIASDPTDAPPLFTFTDGGGLRDLSSDVIDALLRIAGDPGAGIFHRRSASCRRRARTSTRGCDAVRLPIALVHFRAGRGAHAASVGSRQAIGRRVARGAETRTDRRGAAQQPRP